MFSVISCPSIHFSSYVSRHLGRIHILSLGGVLVSGYLFAATDANAQGQPVSSEAAREEIIITANGRSTDSFHTPFSTLVIDSESIQSRRQSRTLPEIFLDEPSVMVQKTSNGQGSPYIRGFTGFRTLILIDGIRLNNSTFRDGPNQYWNTIDQFTVQQMEIVKGPSSILYGSDSIGGTVNLRTQRFNDRTTNSGPYGFRSVSRMASTDDSFVQRLEYSTQISENLNFIAGISLKHFDDVKAGGTTGTQPNTGYEEQDGNFRLEYQIDDNQELVFAHQQVDQEDVWRTHRTASAVPWKGTAIGSDKHRILDQYRSLSYVQYKATDLANGLDALSVSLSLQNQEEQQNRLRSNFRSEFQGVDVETLGLSIQAQTDSQFGYLVFGTEYYADDVNSFFRSYNTDGSLREVRVQGPVADDASSELFGIYLQDELKISDKTDLNLGLRYTRANVDADGVLDVLTGDLSRTNESWNQVTGSIRLSYLMNDNFLHYAGVSQGFRAPNLSDLTRLDTARSNEIETPSLGLGPEKYISYEVGSKYRKGAFYLQASYYYTSVRDQIVRFPTGVVIDNDNEVQKANLGDGFVQGVEWNLTYDFNLNWQLFSAFAWTEGELSTYPTSIPVKIDEPIDRMAPASGILGIRWSSVSANGLGRWFEAHMRGVSSQERLSTRDKSDTSRIPPGGSPGYSILNLRTGWELTQGASISIAIENIFDQNYRIHGSGQNEPGRNILASLEIKL